MIVYNGIICYSIFNVLLLSCSSSIPVATDGDHPDSEIVNSLNGEDLKQEDEEFRRRVELEALERKLEETLEYQRRIEKEAKQKHLAEQHKKSSCTHPEKLDDGPLNDVYLERGPVDSGVQEQSKPFVQVFGCDLIVLCMMFLRLIFHVQLEC